MAPKLDVLKSWSYSVYTQYGKCPLSVCFDKIKRIRMIEPPNPHFEKGDRVHKGTERYLTAPEKELKKLVTAMKKEGPTLPTGEVKPKSTYELLKPVEGRLTAFRKLKAMAEQEWAFTKEYATTRWNDWDNCWLRIKVDVCATTAGSKKTPPLIQITDWKTGKIYDDHKQQRSLYALGGLQLVELGLLAGGDKKVKLVAEHLYTDTTQTATEEFTMKDLKPLKTEWAARIKQMMSDTKYPAKTGFHCRYCKYRKSNGGPCPEAM